MWFPYQILIGISRKFVPKGSIDSILPLVQIMAWRRIGDKPLSEPMLTDSLTHICGTRERWVNALPLKYVQITSDAITQHNSWYRWQFFMRLAESHRYHTGGLCSNNLSISKFQRCSRCSLGLHKYFYPTFYNGCNYLSMLGLKLISVGKRVPWKQDQLNMPLIQ